VAAILGAMLPVFALIAIGHLLRAWRLLEDGFWRPAEKLTYFLLLPALLVDTLANADFVDLAVARPALLIVLSVSAASAILIGLRPRIAVSGPAFSSIVQGAVRFNAFIGFATVTALFGKPGLAAAAIASALLVPVGNLVSIAALAYYGSGPKLGALPFLRAVLGNPLILACFLGAAIGFLKLPLTFGVLPLLHLLGEASLPLGLLAIGAALDLGAFRGGARAIAASTLAKLVAMPLASWSIGRLIGFDGLPLVITVLFQALPTAPSSYIAARQLGGDYTLMAAILTVETGAAAITLPLALWLIG
jgi:malonate transporter and related proteins